MSKVLDILLVGLDKTIPIRRVAEINLTGDKEFIIFEKAKDGSWILNYTKSTIPEIKNLKSIELIRIKQ